MHLGSHLVQTDNERNFRVIFSLLGNDLRCSGLIMKTLFILITPFPGWLSQRIWKTWWVVKLLA